MPTRKLCCYMAVVMYVFVLCLLIVHLNRYRKLRDNRNQNMHQIKRPILQRLTTKNPDSEQTSDKPATMILFEEKTTRIPIQMETKTLSAKVSTRGHEDQANLKTQTSKSIASGANKPNSDPKPTDLKHMTRKVNKQIQKTIKSNISTIFSDDFVPEIYNETETEDMVHLCLIAAKAETAGEIKIFARSAILHARRSDVFFHFVVFKGSEKTIPPVFEEIDHAFVNVKYELIEVNLTEYLKQKLHNKVRMTHEWSGLYGVGKIFMYDLLPHVNRCIIIDTDTLFGIDPAFLWSEGQSRLKPPVAIATTWFPGDKYVNTGVTVHHLEYMRQIKFGDLITMKGCALRNENGTEKFLCYHDQLFMNMIMNDHRELFSNFTVSWNLGICKGFRNFTFDSFKDEKTGLFFGVAHITCLPYSLKNVFTEGKGYLRKNLQDYIDFLDGMNLIESGEKKVNRVYK